MTVTYASLATAGTDLSSELRAGVAAARDYLGRDYPVVVGDRVQDRFDRWHEECSPVDRTVLIGRFAWCTPDQVDEAIEIAYAAQEPWRQTPATERIALLRRVADRLERDRFLIAGLIVWEAGKTVSEALAESDEAPVFLRLYCDEYERNDGFRTEMPFEADNVTNVSVMRPYGVWAVISPLNFPLALATGPSAAALVTGNTVVLKPSPAGQALAAFLRDAFAAEGLPAGVLTLLTGGNEVGAAVTSNPRLGGVTFTGSYAVGSHIATALAPESKPVIAEMGGKNPALVGATADLDAAAEGIVRSAFGYSGQKCSACSRVFADAKVYDELVAKIVEKTEAWTVGDPTQLEGSTGPLINEAAVERFTKFVKQVRSEGGRVLVGGERLTEGSLAAGTYVAPAVVEAPEDSRVWIDELFAPLLAVRAVDSISQAIDLANASEYGLTAGIYSHDESEVEEFFDRIQSSVLYVNRRSGVTTGAWPGFQPISGWKHSGNTGRGTAGPHYLQQYLREQSRTVVDE